MIDPASPAFVSLPRQEQARVYHANGWSVQALADEFDVTTEAVRYWVDPKVRERMKAYSAAYHQTERGREVARAKWRRYNAKRNQREAA